MFALAAVLVLLANVAWAQQGKQGRGGQDPDQRRQKVLQRFDADGDGKLNEQERQAFEQARQARRGRRGGQGAQQGRGQRQGQAGRGGAGGRGNRNPQQQWKRILELVDDGENVVDVVAVDEGQFFDLAIPGVCNVLASRGTRVIVAGLDTDFRGEPFGPMPQLMAEAEKVDKLQAICVVCGAPASRTQRLINGVPASFNDPVIFVGASEAYEARCRHCHEVPGRPMPER